MKYNHEEYVELDEATKVPVPGTETAFLRLKASSGEILRAEIPHGDLDRVLRLMFPKDFASSVGMGLREGGTV